MLDAGDSLHVFDSSNRRFTVYDPSLRLVRTITTELRVHKGVRLAGGEYALTGRYSTPAAVGRLVHLLKPDGSVLRSVGGTEFVVP